MVSNGFILVGWGYRSRAWLSVADAVGVPCRGVVVRSPRSTPVPGFATIQDAVEQTGAGFAVASVSPDSASSVMVDAVAQSLPILSETPPAADLAGLRSVWDEVGASGLVQVAEQYPLYPSHAARLELVRSGFIGQPTQVQVSSTQLHHAAALMRAYLHVEPGPVSVRATTTVAPLLQPLSRAGWTGADEATAATTTHAVIDFGDSRSGIYDFTDQQTRNLLRFRRLVVRGTHGELDGDRVLRWGGPETILSSSIERRQSGHDLDMSGFDSETLSHGDTVLWRNPWPGQHWPDDHLATAAMLHAMATWVDGEGPEPYPLREASQDAAIGRAIELSARSGDPVSLDHEPWW